MSVKLLLLPGILLLPWVGAAQDSVDWLSEDIQENASRDFAQRVKALGVREGATDEELLSGARKAIGDMRDRLDSLGLEGIIGAAPDASGFPIADRGDPILTAMGRYALCRMPLEAAAEDETLTGEDLKQRFAATIYVYLLDLTNLYLRVHYYAQGGNEPEIKAALTGEPLDSLAARVQTDREAMQTLMNECAPRIGVLLTGE